MILLVTIISILLAGAFLDRNVSLRRFFRFLISIWLSCGVLMVLVLLLTGLGQGLTLIVKLFFNWPDMLLTLVLINFLALILSHFPYYFDTALQSASTGWRKYPAWGILGYVYHIDDSQKEAGSIRFIRRHIGVLMYLIWLYVLLYVDNSVFGIGYSVDVVVGVLWGVLLLFQWFVGFVKQHINAMVNKIADGIDTENVRMRIGGFLLVFETIFFINIALTALFLYRISSTPWSRDQLLFLCGLSMLHAIQYILFRTTRPWMVYYGRSKEPKDHYFSKPTGVDNVPTGLVRPFYILSSHVWYLVAMSAFGIALTCLLLWMNGGDGLMPVLIHPVTLVLIFVIVYYSVIVIALKHFIYNRSVLHDQNVEHGSKQRKRAYFLNIGFMIFGLMAIAFLFMTHYRNNHLHTLEPVVHGDSKIVDLPTFVEALDTSRRDFFIVGSYGGGLKAHLWNLLILNELAGTHSDFLDATLCFSGVSGGAMGLTTFYSALHDGRWPEVAYRNYLIDTIGNSNSLSLDLNGLLFSDLIREALPSSWLSDNPADRSIRSMHYFQQLTLRQQTTIENIHAFGMSMPAFWSDVFRDRNYIPAVIFNTTPTTARFGVACSVEGMSDFPISINLIDFEGHSDLSFADAASTTNRFPVFSPAARVPGKGHFVDGGYFENSGMMLAMSFYEQLAGSLPFLLDRRINAVNIVNDKSLYILEKFGPLMGKVKRNAGAGEITSILKGIVALERMPNYMRYLIENHPDSLSYFTLHMPYTVTREDIMEVFGADSLSHDARLYDLIEMNNKMVTEALEHHHAYRSGEWGIVTPPLGRLLSLPAREYQKAMIGYHPEILGVLDSLKLLADPTPGQH